jgi:hypothetical protein
MALAWQTRSYSTQSYAIDKNVTPSTDNTPSCSQYSIMHTREVLSKELYAFFSSNLGSGVISGSLWELPGSVLAGALLTVAIWGNRV